VSKVKRVLIREVREELPENFKRKVIDMDCKANTLVGNASFYTFLALIQRA
jgi:hypothetical protein